MKIIFDDEEQKRTFVRHGCVRWFNIGVNACTRTNNLLHTDCENCMSEYIEMEVEKND